MTTTTRRSMLTACLIQFLLLMCALQCTTAEIPQMYIDTFAGNGIAGPSGSSGPATDASLQRPTGLFVDSNMQFLYIAEEYQGNLVRRVSFASGIITNFAGTGISGNSGNGGPATAAEFDSPESLWGDTVGNIFIVDGNDVIRIVDTVGIVNAYASTGRGSTGDGGPAIDAKLYQPGNVVTDTEGNMYIADQSNQRIRYIEKSTGIISNYAGGSLGYVDSADRTLAQFTYPKGLWLLTNNDLYVAEGYNGHRVRLISGSTGAVTTIAGGSISGSSGDGGVATSALLNYPTSVWVATSNMNIYIADQNNNKIRVVDGVTQIISTFAGKSGIYSGGDGGLASNAGLYLPVHVVGTANEEFMFVSEYFGYYVRMLYHAPTSAPTPVPTVVPTVAPSEPTHSPTDIPTAVPSLEPTPVPTYAPSSSPTAIPTSSPSAVPTSVPSTRPTAVPTSTPTSLPTSTPSASPTAVPTSTPSSSPTAVPTSSPSAVPTSVPSTRPTAVPTSTPTSLPTSTPTSAPTTVPTPTPSSSPTSVPTPNPTPAPSAEPSFEPSPAPSVAPTIEPTAAPSPVPSAEPSFVPSPTPSLAPTIEPTAAPSPVPSAEPSFEPSPAPSVAPTIEPTAVPSLQPTEAPSALPTLEPSEVPTFAPTVCPADTFTNVSVSGNECLPCPANSTTQGVSGAFECFCEDGFETTMSGGYIQCNVCPGGWFSVNGDLCAECVAGTVSENDLGSSICTTCPMNTYAVAGSAVCTACPAGMVTPFTGSPDASYCLNPSANFAMGCLALATTVIMVSFYIGYGRFILIASKRRRHLIYPLVDICRARSTIVFKRTYLSLVSMKSPLKVFSFVFGGVFVVTACSIAYYVVYIYIVLINTMILWRGFGYNLGIDFLARLDLYVEQLAEILPSFILYLFYPIEIVFRYVAMLKIDFGSLSVTCEGSQASVGLFINLVIFGLTVIFIESDYQIFWSTTLQTIQRCTMYKLGDGMHDLPSKFQKLKKGVILFFILLVSLLTNPFQIMLRYLMGFIDLRSFGQNRGFLHKVTQACDEMPGARYIDSVLGYSSSAIVLWLILPVMYIIAHVVLPGCHHFVLARLEDRGYTIPDKDEVIEKIKHPRGGTMMKSKKKAAARLQQQQQQTVRPAAGDDLLNEADIEAVGASVFGNNDRQGNAVGEIVEEDPEPMKQDHHNPGGRLSLISKVQYFILSWISPDMAILRFAWIWSMFMLDVCDDYDDRLIESDSHGLNLNPAAMRGGGAAAATAERHSNSAINKNDDRIQNQLPAVADVEAVAAHPIPFMPLKKRNTNILFGGMSSFHGRVSAQILPSPSADSADECDDEDGKSGKKRFGGFGLFPASSSSKKSSRYTSEKAQNRSSHIKEKPTTRKIWSNDEDTEYAEEESEEHRRQAVVFSSIKAVLIPLREDDDDLKDDSVRGDEDEDKEEEEEGEGNPESGPICDTSQTKRGVRQLKKNKAFQTKSNEFPAYFELCSWEFAELYSDVAIEFGRMFGPALLFMFVYVFGLGHIFTVVGREHWKTVLWKYYSFITVCFGYWSADNATVEGCRLIETKKRFFIHEGRINHSLLREYYVDEIDNRDSTSLLSAVVGTRAIILMVFWNCTVPSVFFVLTCDSPLWVYSDELRAMLPPLLIKEPVAMAAAREEIIFKDMYSRGGRAPPLASTAANANANENASAETGSDDRSEAGATSAVAPEILETGAATRTDGTATGADGTARQFSGYRAFRVYLRALVICTTQGRLLNYLLNVYTFALAIAILFPATVALPALLIIRAPYIIGKACHIFLRYGEVLRLDNSDFEATWRLLCCCCFTTTSGVSSAAEEGAASGDDRNNNNNNNNTSAGKGTSAAIREEEGGGGGEGRGGGSVISENQGPSYRMVDFEEGYNN